MGIYSKESVVQIYKDFFYNFVYFSVICDSKDLEISLWVPIHGRMDG